ncbi:MAG: DUF748 domain-containing protein [Opitutaceae bacterium]
MTRTRKFFTISAILFALYTFIGFLVFPFLIRYFGERALQTHVNEASVIEKVRFNPFTWSLRVEGLSTADAGGAWTAKWALAEVNLSVLTVLKFYPVLDRVVLDGLDMEATRQLAEVAPDEAPVESPETAEGWRKIMERLNQAEIPKLRIDLLEVSNGKAGFTDHTNAEVYAQIIDPINFTLRNLSTVSDGSSAMQFDAETENGARVSWKGTLTSQPLRSEGAFSLEGLMIDQLSPYYAELIRFDLKSAVFGFGFQYQFDLSDLDNLLSVDEAYANLTEVLCSPSAEPATLLSIEAVALEGVGFKFPQMELHVAKVGVTNGETLVHRDADGAINLLQLVAGPKAAEMSEAPMQAEAPAADSALEPLSYVIELIEVTNYHVRWQEDLAQGLASVEVGVPSIKVQGMTSDLAAPFTVDAQYKIGEQGVVNLQGSVVVESGALDFSINAQSIPLSLATAYTNEFADMAIESGAFDFNGKLKNSTADGLHLTGSVEIREFAGQRNGAAPMSFAWDRLSLNELQLATTPFSLAIDAVVLSKPVIQMQQGPSAESSEATEESVEEVAASESGTPPNISIATIAIEEGIFTFVDGATEPSTEFNITELGLMLKDVALAGSGSSSLDLNAMVNGSRLTVNGTLKPSEIGAATTLQVSLSQLALPALSPYSGKAVGRRIAKGAFSLDSNWDIQNNQLKASNKILIDQLQFGDSVKSETAISLPLDLAVTLLSGPGGKMDLSLPLSGDLSDPKAGLGQIIRTAVVGLITNVVSAPFKLLSGLVGSEEDISVVEFDAGQSTLSNAMLDRLNSMATALKERPDLKLAIIPEIIAEDIVALQRTQLRATLLKDVKQSDEAAYQKALAERYGDQMKAAGTPDEETVAETAAGLAKMESYLMPQVVLPESELERLAAERAKVVQAHLTASHGLDATRLTVSPLESVEDGTGLRFDLK